MKRPAINISPYPQPKLKKTPTAKNAPTDKPSFWLTRAKDMIYCNRGRTAILACLKHLKLKRNDEVLIVTTTNGPYISGCVTKTIEKVCRWSRKLSPATRLVLVIHEFGFPCPFKKVKKYRAKGIPILEDCAYSIGSRIEGEKVGTFGDFALYSFSKYYPVLAGGLLVLKTKINASGRKHKASSQKTRLLQHMVRSTHKDVRDWNLARRKNWQSFAKNLPNRFKPYFKLSPKVVPGVYLTTVPKKFKGEIVKKRLLKSGVECTQYYNQGGFYFPVHQFLTKKDRQHILDHFLG